MQSELVLLFFLSLFSSVHAFVSKEICPTSHSNNILYTHTVPTKAREAPFFSASTAPGSLLPREPLDSEFVTFGLLGTQSRELCLLLLSKNFCYYCYLSLEKYQKSVGILQKAFFK